MFVRRRAAAATTPVDVFPEFAPPMVEIQTPCIGLSADGGRGAGHGPARAGAQRRAGPRRSCAPSRSTRPVVDRADLRARAPTCSRRGSSCRSGIATVTPTLPTWAAPPVMLQPLSSTSRVMKIGLSSDDTLADRPVDDRRTGRSGRGCCAVPGVANVAIWGERMQMLQVQVEPDEHAGERRHPRRRSWTATADALDAGLLQYSDGRRHRDRRVHRHAQPAARRPARAAHRRRRRTSAEVADRGARRRSRCGSSDVADVVEDHQPLIGDAVINGGAGPHAHRREVPVGATRWRSREGVEAALEELRPGLPRHRDRRRRSSGRRPSSRPRSTTSPSALLLGCLLVMIVLGAVPLRVAHRADQPGRHPAVAHRGGAGAVPRGARRSTR